MAVRHCQSENHYLFAVVAAPEDSQHVFSVLLSAFADHAEGEVEPHPLSEREVLLLHLRRNDQQQVGQMRVLFVSHLFRVQCLLMSLKRIVGVKQVGGEVGNLTALVGEVVDKFGKGNLILLIDLAEEPKEGGLADREILLHDPIHGGLMQIGRQVGDEVDDGGLV